MLQMSPSSKLLVMMPCRVRRTPSLLLSRLRTMVAMITGGMELTGAGMVLLGMSPLGMLQVAMVSGLGDPQPAPASVDASGADPSSPEPKTEAAASDDTASTGRPGILKPEGGRPSASDASASAADDSFGRLPKVSFASDDDPASAPADGSGASEIPLLVETMVIQCQERCGDCQRAHCGKQFTSWDAARKHRQQMHRCRYCWQLFQNRMQAGGYA